MTQWFRNTLAFCWLAMLAMLATFASPAVAQTASDYTQTASSISATQVKITFRPTTPSALVDIHYNVPGVPEQSFRMANNAGTWEQTISNLASGASVEYWFTYEKAGPLYVTPHFFFTHNGGAGGGTVATPGFTPAPGTYATAQSVSVSTSTAGATIRCTTDGSTPTAASPVYTGPFNVGASTTVKCLAIKSGMTNSAVATAAYTINTQTGGTVATPGFAPGAGTYTGAQSVTITTATAGATIRYTTNGTTPTAASAQYSGPINVATSQTLKAIGIKAGMTNSAVASAAYTINPNTGGTVATPTFNPPGGNYAGSQSVSIFSATAGATLYYTSNGTTPTTASTVYVGPITVSVTTTLKALAVKAGMTNSAVASNTYTIGQQAGDGRFPINFVNNTRGIWRDDQIYVWGLSQNEQGIWCYMLPDGSLAPMRKADENAPNHLTKNGRNYANYAFTIAQARAANFRSWTHVRGGRLYISVGSPVYIPVDDNAWGGPDLLNPNDPNIDVFYDWYEYTYVHNTDVAFGGNTGMVDQFGVPLTHRVVNAALGIDSTKGTTGTHDQILSQYNAFVPPAFRGLASAFRVKAPYKDSFRPGFANANYLQPYIDQVWNQYAVGDFNFQRPGDSFVGRVINGRLQFTWNGAGPFFIDKPTTFDAFGCTGNFAKGSGPELALEAEFCGAFNRGVAHNTANWHNPGAYYQNGAMQNEYAHFWHTNGINGKAYAFAYDDTNDQSSVIIIPNLPSHPYPDSLTITVGW